MTTDLIMLGIMAIVCILAWHWWWGPKLKNWWTSR